MSILTMLTTDRKGEFKSKATAVLICLMLLGSGLWSAQVLAQVNSNITITARVGEVEEEEPSGGVLAGGYPAPTTITFSGRAYPLSKIIILRDGYFAISALAGADARFELSINNLSPGTDTFSVYSEDSSGRRSNILAFPLNISAGVTTTVSGILLAPTISLDKSQVRSGDPIRISGYAAPYSSVQIAILPSVVTLSQTEHTVETVAAQDGLFTYTFDTTPLSPAQYIAKAKAVLIPDSSDYSREAQFSVGNKNVPQDRTCKLEADFNQDCKVNIIDFSILSYWRKRPNVPAVIDLNGDRAVTMADFSILAYYWTG